MLTSFSCYNDKLFLSIKKTEWIQNQFTWNRIMSDDEQKRCAIEDWFSNEFTVFPNSLCLHLVIIDKNNCAVATKIKKRKLNDYPSTIAVTLGEQLETSDFRSGLRDNFVLQWIRRSFIEELGFSESDYPFYVSEGTARVMSLNLEGDIFNFSIVCCVKLNCSCEELYEYYQMHRSVNDEFDEVFPISMSEIPSILIHSHENKSLYHPSSFIRLLYAYIYVNGIFPEI